jgi:hypothetical protein
MGKYQLDDKGQAAVQKFHEKHSNVKTDRKAQLEKLRQMHLEKLKKKES